MAKYIWYKEEDKSRNPHGAFRRSFNLAEAPKTATLHLFADTVYTLHVNGKFVGFGPVRFDPRFPQYDTYDIAPYLQQGANTIAVLANFHGHKVFKSIPAEAAFIAWGTVESAGATIDLSTGTSTCEWKAKQHASYNRYTPKLSFALNAQEHFDQGAFDQNWREPDYNDSPWPAAVTITNQNAFGALIPREIPFMELTPVTPAAVTIVPLNPPELTRSFYFPPPIGYDTAFDAQQGYCRDVHWATYIYSPCAQQVSAGVLYERLWLNGEALPNMEDPVHQLRYNYVLPLKEGWNYLASHVTLFQDIYEGYLALPDDKGLVISATKEMDGEKLFRYLPMQHTSKDAVLKALPSPIPEDVDLTEFGGWVYTTAADSAASPCREASWDTHAPPMQNITFDSLQSLKISKDLYPHGFMITVDMDHMRLVFPKIKFTGAKGATIDFLYSDRLTNDGRHLRSQSWIPLGDRAECGSDTFEWQPTQPRGFRYLGITVRNISNDVDVNGISFLSAHYPVTRLGSFECSDPLLNRIWEMGALTQYLNMEDTYTDCVDRERGLYALDLLIQYHINLVTYGDQPLMKRALELYGQSSHDIGLFRCLYPNTGDYIITDFCLHIVAAFHAYYRQTGDTALVAEYWPHILKNIDVFSRLSDEREDKLLCAEKPAGNWPREPEDNRTGFIGEGGRVDNTGINCMFSCLYLIALREALDMAKAVAQTDVADLEKRIAILEKSIPAAFWNEEKGLFADTTAHDRFSPHPSVYAVNAKVVSPEQRDRLRTTLPPLFQPFFINGLDPTDGVRFETSYGYYMLLALYDLDLPEVAEHCIKEGWRYFLLKGLKTTSEHFDIGNSQCHAWASHPTYMMSRYVLGVSYDGVTGQVNVNPQPGSVTWAKGTVPHPDGLLEVEWKLVDGEYVVTQKLVK